jgi:hypothetical protein
MAVDRGVMVGCLRMGRSKPGYSAIVDTLTTRVLARSSMQLIEIEFNL